MNFFRRATILIGSLVATIAGAQPAAVDVIEFYNPDLDHYFVTASADEAAAIDRGGAGPAWTRTGNSFRAGGPTPVCRFYGSQSPGPNSHFYTADPGECNALKALQSSTPATQKRWNFESLDFQTTVPAGGACPSGTTPVYRAYNNGFTRNIDSNHRITTSQSAISQVVARGWVNEGVVMCAVPGGGGPIAVSLSSTNLRLLPGETRTVYATVTPRSGFGGPVTFALTGLPAGVTQQLSAASVTVGPTAASVALRFTVAANAPVTVDPGIVSLVARANDGSVAQAALALGVAPAGDPVARRLSTIAAVEERARELSRQPLTPLALVQAVSAFMASRPEYKATGVDVETVTAWGRFTDGRVHVVANNRAPAPEAPPVEQATVVDLKAGPELPAQTQARLLHTFGVNFEGQTPINEMRTYLSGAGWGVRAGPEGQGSVEMLKGVNGDGFFYINTHGGRFEVDDPSEPEGKVYGIQTSTLVSDAGENTYAADLSSLKLVHFTAYNGDRLRILGIDVHPDWDTRYAITYRFVDAYMSFEKGSVALINACWSGRNAAFINTFIRKGTSVYLGWSELLSSTAAFRSAPYFVDRMVGANKNADRENPPQRPFSYDLVLQDMAKKGLDFDPENKGTLQATMKTGLTHPPIFAPSIRYVRVDEPRQLLTLTGEFGEEMAKLSVGGTPITPSSWSATEIVAPLPLTGAGSSGDVIVEVRGVRSNARQLTEWSIPLKYLWDNAYGVPTHKFEGTGKVRFRADIGAYRTVPGETVRYVVRGGAPTRDSVLPIAASGSYSNGGCTETLSGSANYISPAARDNGAQVPVLASAFRMEGETGKTALALAFGFSSSPHVMTFSGMCQGVYEFAPTMSLLDGRADVLFDQSETPTVLQLSALQFKLDDQFNIPPLTRTVTNLGGTINISWVAVPAQTPPRDGIDAGK